MVNFLLLIIHPKGKITHIISVVIHFALFFLYHSVPKSATVLKALQGTVYLVLCYAIIILVIVLVCVVIIKLSVIVDQVLYPRQCVLNDASPGALSTYRYCVQGTISSTKM